MDNPTFHKSDTTVGFATAWRAGPSRYTRFSYLWPRFDTNYAFKNTSVNEGYTEAFRRFPGEARLESVWQNTDTTLFLDTRFGRPWELDHKSLEPMPTGYIEEGEMAELHAEARHRTGPWTCGLRIDTLRSAGSIAHTPALPAQDVRVDQKHHRFLMSMERKMSERRTLRAQAGPSVLRGSKEVPAQANDNDSYRYDDFLGELSYLPRWSARWRGETSYMIDLQKADLVHGAEPSGISTIHNRLKFVLRWDGVHGSLVAAGNVELDQSDAESWVSFDGGTLQFQVLFR